MKSLTDRLAFLLGFIGGLGIFTIANLISYPMSGSLRISPKIGLLDDGHAFGFPFAFYFVWIGLPRETAFVMVEALANLVVALVCSLLIGYLLRTVLRKRGYL